MYHYFVDFCSCSHFGPKIDSADKYLLEIFVDQIQSNLVQLHLEAWIFMLLVVVVMQMSLGLIASMCLAHNDIALRCYILMFENFHPNS